MATNHTENYQLNLWEPTDDFLREEFNENTQKLEAALVNHDAAIAAKGNCRILCGTYTGTGTYGQSNPNVLEFEGLESPPKLVIISHWDGYYHVVMIRGMDRACISNWGNTAHYLPVTWTDKGVSWYNTESAAYQLNGDFTYYYIVLY